VRPLIGGYYWSPKPSAEGTAWEDPTCRDVGHPGTAGHAQFWADVVARLASALGLEPAALVRRFGRSHDINHGDDAPVPDGVKRVQPRFGLDEIGVRDVVSFDPHERMLRGDPRALQETLGVVLGLRGI